MRYPRFAPDVAIIATGLLSVLALVLALATVHANARARAAMPRPSSGRTVTVTVGDTAALRSALHHAVRGGAQ